MVAGFFITSVAIQETFVRLKVRVSQECIMNAYGRLLQRLSLNVASENDLSAFWEAPTHGAPPVR